MTVLTAACLKVWDRPVRAGLPVSANQGLVGTLGALARDRSDGTMLVLGTSHVLCPSGSTGAAIWQPGPCDQKDCDCNRVGFAWREQCGLVVSDGHKYFLDCAVARLDDDVPWDPMVAGQRIKGMGYASRGMRVWKVGAGSGETAGVVIEDRHEERALFHDGYRTVPNQLLIQSLHGAENPFSVIGDSGALMFDEDGRAIGLLWGASPSGYALACPIKPVFDALAIDLEMSG